MRETGIVQKELPRKYLLFGILVVSQKFARTKYNDLLMFRHVVRVAKTNISLTIERSSTYLVSRRRNVLAQPKGGFILSVGRQFIGIFFNGCSLEVFTLSVTVQFIVGEHSLKGCFDVLYQPRPDNVNRHPSLYSVGKS